MSFNLMSYFNLSRSFIKKTLDAFRVAVTPQQREDMELDFRERLDKFLRQKWRTITPKTVTNTTALQAAALTSHVGMNTGITFNTISFFSLVTMMNAASTFGLTIDAKFSLLQYGLMTHTNIFLPTLDSVAIASTRSELQPIAELTQLDDLDINIARYEPLIENMHTSNPPTKTPPILTPIISNTSPPLNNSTPPSIIKSNQPTTGIIDNTTETLSPPSNTNNVTTSPAIISGIQDSFFYNR